MWISKQGIARAAGGVVLLISLISTGMVVAHQCHQEAVQVASHSHHDGAGKTEPVPSSLLTDICIGVTFLVLLIGRKFWLRQKHSNWRISLHTSIKELRGFIKPPNLVLRLSLPQLGVCRI
jgi:hypothetical protein